MKSFRSARAVLVCAMLAVVVGDAQPQSASLPKSKGAYVTRRTVASPFANQAAAADEKFVYAIDNGVIAKLDRASGKELARSTGKAEHLNSGFFWQDKLYCAHSNYPKMPHQSDIRVLDPATMALTVYRIFEDPPGSLTWAVRRGDRWWCHFAHYGKEKAKSVLLSYDENWKETGRWTYPPQLIADWENYSLSGGIWHDDELLTTGHDKKVIYRLKLPMKGNVVEIVDVISSPFPGQGIAADPVTGGLIGIDRSRRQVVIATFEKK